MFRYVLFVILLLMSTPHLATPEPEYLRQGTFIIPMDTRTFRTILPLEPAHLYHIILSSADNLRPFVAPQFCNEHQRNSFLAFFMGPYTLCFPPVLFDGNQLPTANYLLPDDLRSYFYYDTYPDDHISKLEFFFWGEGRSLTLQTSKDFSNKIQTAIIEIKDITIFVRTARVINLVCFSIVAILIVVPFGFVAIIEWLEDRQNKRSKSMKEEKNMTQQNNNLPQKQTSFLPQKRSDRKLVQSHDSYRFSKEIEAQTSFFDMELEEALEKRKIKKETNIQIHHDEAKLFIEAKLRESMMKSEIVVEQALQDMLAMVADMNLSEEAEKQLIKRLYQIRTRGRIISDEER